MIKRFYIFVVLFVISFQSTYACDEKIKIYTIEYKIIDQWCGRKIEKAKIADPEKLEKLPKENSHLDYNIYVSRETRKAFLKMADAAARDSLIIIAKSGYRSAGYQRQVIKKRMAEGKSFEEVIRYVAPPGYSEHETGCALDLIATTTPFSKSRLYKWLKINAGKFGFHETYPNDPNSSLPWEPWHWCYREQIGSQPAPNSTR